MDERQKVPVFPSGRWNYALVTCVGCIFLYGLRINMSVAIVCMVKGSVRNVTNATSSNVTTYATGTDSCGRLETDDRASNQGEFDWSRQTSNFILGSFYIGYLVTQIPGGWLASRFGGKHVHGTGMLVTAVATLLVPVAARATSHLVVALRIIMGLGTGVSFPAMATLAGCWAPPQERSRIITFSLSGIFIGTILTLAVSGLLCAMKYDNGWPLTFYVFGGATLIWWLFWNFLVYDSPYQHPRISKAEKRYIAKAIGKNADGSRTDIPLPWLKILSSSRVWAIFVTHTFDNVGGYTLLTCLPQYMKDVLRFNIKANGALSALPFLVIFVTSLVGGFLADMLVKHKILTITSVRKIFQVIGFLGPGLLMVALSFVDCTERALAVALLAFAAAFMSGSMSGYSCNAVDIAPRFAGIIFGLSNTLATIPGIIMPIIVGSLTVNGTREEWQRVFFIVAACYCLGAIVFVLLASGEVQKWALEEEQKTIETDIVKPFLMLTRNDSSLRKPDK